jgi:glutathione S-transferase
MTQRLLVIGNKRYSSWSLRGWIGLKQLGLPFQERRISLYVPGYKEELAPLSPSGKVPVLIDDGITVHDSLAILEYLNETYAKGAWLPKAPKARALARSIGAEMHSGFQNMRQNLNMNLGRGARHLGGLPPRE